LSIISDCGSRDLLLGQEFVYLSIDVRRHRVGFPRCSVRLGRPRRALKQAPCQRHKGESLNPFSRSVHGWISFRSESRNVLKLAVGKVFGQAGLAVSLHYLRLDPGSFRRTFRATLLAPYPARNSTLERRIREVRRASWR